MTRTTNVAVVLFALAVAPAWAQTNDGLYRGWAWRAEIAPARATGLGGAFVAVADDSSAAWLNPAGLATLRKVEFSGGVLSRSEGKTSVGDVWAARTGLGVLSGGGKLTPRWAIGGYLVEPHAADIALAGGADTGSLQSTVSEGGAAVAWQPRPQLQLGARLTISHLKLEGVWSQWAGADELLRVGTSSGATRVTGSFGALLRVGDAVRLGAVAEAGVSYECDRTAIAPAAAQNLELDGRYDLRQPSRVAGGIAWQASPKVLVTGQLDYLRYSEMEVSVRQGVGTPGDYATADAVEPRGGIELSLPLGGVSVQLRGGVHLRANGGIAHEGSSAWPGDEKGLELAGGVSLVGRSWRLDLGGSFGGLRTVFVAGVTLRP